MIAPAETLLTSGKPAGAIQPSVLVLVPWFGKWPEWMRFYIESCRWNPTIDWLMISDCGEIDDKPDNVSVLHTTLDDYREYISRRLSLECVWDQSYKLCDLRPLFGELHSDRIKGYDYWGYGDIDVIYGNIRQIYTNDVLTHDIISPHDDITAGHFTLVRNTERLNHAFRKVRGWRSLVSRREHRGFDEYQWSHLFTPTYGSFYTRLKQRLRSPYLGCDGHFVEQHSTDLFPRQWIDGTRNYPRVWSWDEGRLTADNGGDREFLYLHFTHWQSSRWTGSGLAPWKKLARLDNLPAERPRRFSISAQGFNPL